MRSEPATRTVSGGFSGAGAVVTAGSADWTVTKTGTGAYTVRFQRPFRGPPAATLAPQSYTTVACGTAADLMTISTWAPNTGGSQDAAVYFTATGR